MKNSSLGNLYRFIPKIKLILIVTILLNYASIANSNYEKNSTSLINDKNKSNINTTSNNSNITNENENAFPNYTIPQNIQTLPVISIYNSRI